MTYYVRTFKIEIDLINNIYVFDEESATGKTYLYKRLKSLYLANEPVFAVSYPDWIIGKSDILRVLNEKQFEVVMFDRFSQYYTGLDDLLLKLSKQSVVLAETKCGMCNVPIYGCAIEFDERGIYVYE